MPPRPPKDTEFAPRWRVMSRGEIAFGPGKADLLAAIEQTGSLSLAAKALGMSYMRAWGLLKTMNRVFKSPLVESSRGGIGRGGARLTWRGEAVLAIYRDMQAKSMKATVSDRKLMTAHLAKEDRSP